MFNEIDLTQFPEQFREALDSIKMVESRALAIAPQENFVIVYIGESDLEEVYEERKAQIFVRIPLAFPNAHPYGIITAPFLHRKDQREIERQHLNHPNVQPVRLLLPEDLGFWSWDWSAMPCSKPTDLCWAVEWARKRIREA